MDHKRRWDPCVAHHGDDVNKFLADYFAQPDRNALLVAGAGFDPRSRAVATLLSETAASLHALFIREDRPRPPQDQSARAEANTSALVATLADRQVVVPIEIFGPDNAVVGGRSVITALNRQGLESVTDVIVDVSALSPGTSFPIIRYFVERIVRGKGAPNPHVFVVHNPRLDDDIRSIDSDLPGYVHGFKGRSTLSGTADATRLWLPQLAPGRRATLERLHGFVKPDDTCPILPFPASDPRIGDVLAKDYLINELETPWSVDQGNRI